MEAQRVAIFVDEANLRYSAKKFELKVKWDGLREFLANEGEGRRLTECVVYVGLAPNMDEFRECRKKQDGFVHWLRTQGYSVVALEGSLASPRTDSTPIFKANVDVLMALDGLEYAIEVRPDIVVLVTGDGDFAQLALKLRRRGIRVEVAAVNQSIGPVLRAAANGFTNLSEFFNCSEALNGDAAPIGTDTVFDN